MNEQKESNKKSRARSKLKNPLPDVRISFDKHFEIIKAYAVASDEGKKPISYRDFEKLVSINPQIVSGNNEFFENLGLIKEVEKQRGRYIPTDITLELNNELKWNKTEEAKTTLKKLLSTSWFWNSTKQLLEVKQSVTRTELQEKLGYDSGADPKKHLPALNVIMEYLIYVGLIKEQDDKLTFGEVEIPSTKPKEKIELERTIARAESIVPPIIFGVLVSPEMSEEQIRNAVRIILDEQKKLREKSDWGKTKSS
jgi:hypothetical protein